MEPAAAQWRVKSSKVLDRDAARGRAGGATAGDSRADEEPRAEPRLAGNRESCQATRWPRCGSHGSSSGPYGEMSVQASMDWSRSQTEFPGGTWPGRGRGRWHKVLTLGRAVPEAHGHFPEVLRSAAVRHRSRFSGRVGSLVRLRRTIVNADGSPDQ